MAIRRIALTFGVMLTLLAGITALAVVPDEPIGVATDTGDDSDYNCPAGTVYESKADGLTGFTFTVPSIEDGETILAVIIKVGGPGGGTHITFLSPTPGAVLSVAYQEHAISHAHVCYGPTATTSSTTSTSTTSTSSTTTTSSTTSTTLPPTGSQFSINPVLALCDPVNGPVISITFGTRADLNGQTGTLVMQTSIGQTFTRSLTYQSGATVTIPYPAGLLVGLSLTYTLGSETATAIVNFPAGCTAATTTTTAPGQTTTTTLPPGGSTTTTAPSGGTTTVPGRTPPPPTPAPTTTSAPGLPITG